MLEEFSHLFHGHLNNSITFRLKYFSNDFLSQLVGYHINNNKKKKQTIVTELQKEKSPLFTPQSWAGKLNIPGDLAANIFLM